MDRKERGSVRIDWVGLTEIDDAADNVAWAAEEERYIRERDALRRIGPGLANSVEHEMALFFCQPVAVLRKVGDEEESSDANQHGRDAFEYENPSPITITSYTIHISNSAS